MLRKLCLLAVFLLATGACATDGTDDTASDPTPDATPAGEVASMDVTGTDFAFEAPENVPAGLTEVTLDNQGEESHQVAILRLKEGETMQSFTAAVQESEAAALGKVEFSGGPNEIPAGASGSATVELREGDHLLACFIPSADGVPHLAKGMLAPMTVTAAEGDPAPEPEADQTVTTDDFSFDLPEDGLTSGTIRIENAGEQVHEIGLLKVAPDKTPNDVQAFFQAEEPQGPPPFASAGGYVGVAPGEEGWFEADLDAGTYFAVCFIPDPGSGQPHLALGMLETFTVS